MSPFFQPSELIDKLKSLGLYLNKNRGQCFLIDRNIATFIVDSIKPSETDSILEIGPGLGTLTDFIAQKAGKLFIIEHDKKFFEFQKEHFEGNSKIEVIHADALKCDWPIVNKIISNVPYQISGPLFAKIAKSEFEKGVFMVQKEFADRLTAQSNTNNYGRLSVIYSLLFEVKILKQVSNAVFFPKPKVQSTIISVEPKMLEPDKKSKIKANLDSLFYFLQIIFPYKNKILRRAILESIKAIDDKDYKIKLEKLLERLNDREILTQRVRAINPDGFQNLIEILENTV